MHIILLSGGSGRRLWPLSNDIRSKQFIKIFKRESEYESMVQRMFRQIRSVDSDATITIATSKSQVSAIRSQLGDNVELSVEPFRRDTFPAIALATAYLHDVMGIDENEAVVVCPVDPYVEDGYFLAIKQLWEMAENGAAKLNLMGIQPTYPSEKYGYILPASKEEISQVSEFKEKPDVVTAQKYIDAGGLWNGGVFAYKLSYVLERAHELMDFSNYQDLYERYETLKKISFDYAVVEHEKDISVLRYHGEWKDLGTWNTLTEAMDSRSLGDARMNDTCSNTHVINALDVPILVMGIKDAVIAASPEGILVTDKEQSSYIKPYVDEIKQPVMFAEKSWGSYRVLDVGVDSLTVKVTLNPGHRMNYHSHERREETWMVIHGTGYVIIDGEKRTVKTGDVIELPRLCRHTVIAETELQLIEVQMGTDIDVSDKEKYAWPTN